MCIETTCHALMSCFGFPLITGRKKQMMRGQNVMSQDHTVLLYNSSGGFPFLVHNAAGGNVTPLELVVTHML